MTLTFHTRCQLSFWPLAIGFSFTVKFFYCIKSISFYVGYRKQCISATTTPSMHRTAPNSLGMIVCSFKYASKSMKTVFFNVGRSVIVTEKGNCSIVFFYTGVSWERVKSVTEVFNSYSTIFDSIVEIGARIWGIYISSTNSGHLIGTFNSFGTS